MACRQQADIVFALGAGVQHQHVPGAVGTGTAAARGGIDSGKGRQVGELLVAGKAALLGFEHEAVALVEIDALGGDGAVAGLFLDDALEDVVVGLMGGGRRVRMGKTQEIAELRQEERIICPLLPALLALPAGNERFNLGLHLSSPRLTEHIHKAMGTRRKR